MPADISANRADHESLTRQLAERIAAAGRGGSAKARERHLARGKLLPRDRVAELLDPGSPFLEIAPRAANGLSHARIGYRDHRGEWRNRQRRITCRRRRGYNMEYTLSAPIAGVVKIVAGVGIRSELIRYYATVATTDTVPADIVPADTVPAGIVSTREEDHQL